MKYDILKTIRTTLLNDATITSHVGVNVSVRKLPNRKVTKQITLRKTAGPSNSIICSRTQTVYISVWVLQKDIAEPYKECVEIVERVTDLFNRKGESLNTGDLIINQITNMDSEIDYDETLEYWFGIIILECVTND